MLSICFQAQTLYANRCLVTGREGCRLGLSSVGRETLISYGLQELCRVRRGRIALRIGVTGSRARRAAKGF
jgi:hypothetical protein